MSDAVLIVLTLLFIKHFVVDFILQTDEQVKSKGIYLDWPGVTHSIYHGIGTFLVVTPFTDIVTGLAVGLIDFLLHYHIDWSKININKKFGYTPEHPKFWFWLGADQMLHSFTYIWITWTLS